MALFKRERENFFYLLTSHLRVRTDLKLLSVLPITTSIPAGQGVTMNFANPLASSSSL